jgi:hypothetical protein
MQPIARRARRAQLGGAATAFLSFNLACGPMAVPDGPEGGRLAGVDVPDGFDFETTRPVTLRLAIDGPGADFGALEVALEDGPPLFRGPLARGEGVTLRLVAPTKDRSLVLRLGRDGRWVTVHLPLDAANLSHVFRS